VCSPRARSPCRRWHVATCLIHEIEAIVSPDIDFDAIGEVRRIAP